MIRIVSLKSKRDARNRVKMVFDNDHGARHCLELNASVSVTPTSHALSRSEELRTALAEFLLDYGFASEPPARRGWSEQSVANAQARLATEQEHVEALAFLKGLGARDAEPSMARIYRDAAEEFVQLRELAVLMHERMGLTMGPLIGRMVRGACRDISERLTDRLLNCPDAEVYYTTQTCPKHALPGKRVREHCVPLRLIHNRILVAKDAPSPGPHCRDTNGYLEDAEAIAQFLVEQFTFASVTPEQDRDLHPPRSMPRDWFWGDDKMLRYKHASSPVPHFVLGNCPQCGATEPPANPGALDA